MKDTVHKISQSEEGKIVDTRILNAAKRYAFDEGRNINLGSDYFHRLQQIAPDAAKDYTEQYASLPILDVTKTKNYSLWEAWAFTIPPEQLINIWPEEFVDPYLGVLDHEIAHNVHPHKRNERHITEIGNGPMRYHNRKMFRLNQRYG